MKKEIHIVCFDCPTPADYGGAIDMYYRIKALLENNFAIHLHYFSYNNRTLAEELKKGCQSVHVYARKTGRKGISAKLPYIVSSRIHEDLIQNLNSDAHPVLLEGIHCTGIINRLNRDKKMLVRIHNDEQEYYHQLAANTTHLLKKWYYKRESRLLHRYQQNLPKQVSYCCITAKDTESFKNKYGLENVFTLPAFIPFSQIISKEGLGNFCLYHGNLSIAENEKAARWLIEKVFNKINYKLIIAGKNPSNSLKKLASSRTHIELIENPDEYKLSQLIADAHIHVLPAFSSTGIKLKLLHALFAGRHCVVNKNMIAGTGLEAACHTGTTAMAFASIIIQLQFQPFTEEELKLRTRLISHQFNKQKNCQLLNPYLS